MPVSGKKKKGRRKKKVSEEARERKKLVKWDTKAMKYILSVDMYSKLIGRLLQWYDDNEKLVTKYFLALPCPFEVSLLEDFIRSIQPLGSDDPLLLELAEEKTRPGKPVVSKNALYTSMSVFCKGLMDLGAPYTEMELHILCRLIQFVTTVKSPTENEEATGDEADEKEANSSRTKSSAPKLDAADQASTSEAEGAGPPTLKDHPELFQDLVVKVSGASKVLKAEEQWTWDLLKSDVPVMMKSKEQILWIKDIVAKRKAAEAKKKKKKKKKKKRAKSAKIEFERCKTCNLILSDTYSGPKASEYGYINVMCKYARRDNIARHPLHVLVYAQAHWLMAQVAASIIEQTDLPTSKVLLYALPPNFQANSTVPTNSVLPIECNMSLQEFGCTGGSRQEPTDLLLYYDYRQPKITSRCPLLNAESLYDYGENKTYKEQSRAYQINYAKTYLNANENTPGPQPKARRKGTDSEDDDSDADDESSDSDS